MISKTYLKDVAPGSAPGTPAAPHETWWRSLDGSGWRAYCDASSHPGVGWEALEPLLALDGMSAGQEAKFHYIVETDIPVEAAPDFNNWYDTEHLPGLSKVPGTIKVRRFRRLSGSPLYVACYDLVSSDVLEHPAWLAVRHTDWSSRVRPLFMNTRRSMFEKM
jgi:hypothetical protein